jgi:hypothetical protein
LPENKALYRHPDGSQDLQEPLFDSSKNHRCISMKNEESVVMVSTSNWQIFSPAASLGFDCSLCLVDACSNFGYVCDDAIRQGYPVLPDRSLLHKRHYHLRPSVLRMHLFIIYSVTRSKRIRGPSSGASDVLSDADHLLGLGSGSGLEWTGISAAMLVC